MFKQVNQRQSFPELEKEIIEQWKKNDTFKKSIETRESSEEFNFYDGPPFATWTPHYGHILAWTIKDVIPRYQTMLWKKVERRFGWDCHWLPIENIVEKKLEISGKDDIENKIWVYNFNETCRANVFWYAQDWKKVVERMWRWVDMENDYKTMDTSFMESVWWVFKNIYDKWLIYEGNRIVPYCPRCTTPLSNFEVNQGYKDKQSKTVTVKFKVSGSENKYILAWTTTPWTLYANLWLAVWNDIMYSEVLDKATWETYVLASEKIKDYYKKEEDFVIVREYKWSCLVGIKYEPLFPDFQLQLSEMWKDLWTWIKLWKNSFSVVVGHHVTTETWVWIVHIAPAYGEDDFIIWEKEDLWFVAHINNSGKTYNLLDKNDINVFEFNDFVINTLKENKLSINIWTIVHSYPHCWRCDTPLIYRWISAWYVAVEKIRDKMVENNKKINWTPEVIKEWRFGKWIEQARDWNISRNRYWWSAIPVWQNEDKKQEVCVWSIDELYKLNKDYGQITKVLFVRHAESTKNLDNINDGTDEKKYELTDKWLKQSEELKEILKTQNVDVIYCSPFHRTKETIKKFSQENNIELILDERVRECNHWIYEQKSQTDEYKIEKEKFKNDKSHKLWTTWDSQNDILERWESFLEEKIKQHKWKTIVVVSHGYPLSIILNKFSSWMDYFSKENKPKNAKVHTKYFYSSSLKEVDLHKHFVDEIFVKHPTTWEKLKRIPEVLDCWFESWAMPYASKHYPFENNENFKFPWDFIAEWLDQTRWWFYTLLILGTALFENTPFLNCIVNWIILAEDGKKMSKKLKNYTDPTELMDKHGADAMRFYLMNSPVVEAQDLRFSDGWVEEVVKKVILPLWNTYSFFTTYANIDKFTPNNTNIYYVRHGQTDNNKNKIVNGWDDDIDLNEKGINDINILGKKIKSSWIKFDVIITSPMTRTKHTTSILKSYFDYNVNIIEMEEFREQSYWEFRWMSHDEIIKKYNCKNNRELSRIYRNNSEENVLEFEKRVIDWYKLVEEKYAWKNILIVSHGGVFRPINKYINNLTTDEAFFGLAWIKNSKLYKLPNYKKSNNLDKWIISELNILIWHVRKWLDEYKLNEPTKYIVKFMDNLTNWYIRRSRKRFWSDWMTQDKFEAYSTLYEVLIEVTKVIAPYMPFVSEYIFTNITWKSSVHLELFPEKNVWFIFEELSKYTNDVQNLITLWLSARANSKIRVRQPLSYAKITTKLTPYFEEILKEELNVKEIKLFNLDEIPSQICKPNARLIWPKFWNNVKLIISEAKSWNFKLLDSWSVLVWEFELSPWEFEVEFVSKGGTKNQNEIIESWNGTVIELYTFITDDLKLEWYARDFVRHIQEARKSANFNVDDRIEISISWNNIENILNKFKNYIESETLSTIKDSMQNYVFEKELEVEDLKINLRLNK